MWAPEFAGGSLALLRVPLTEFSAKASTVAFERYSALEGPEATYNMQNRFVGDHLLYGSGIGWWGNDSGDQHVYIKAYKTAETVQALELGHGVDRIEPLGSDAALVVGNDGADLELSAIALEPVAEVRDVHVRPDAVQGETRSHGFFFKADADGGSGVLGLPARLDGEAWRHLIWGSAEVLYLLVSPELKLSSLGALQASAEQTQEDACKVSCVDWYGNARPIFYHDRVFALLGYELIEGTLSQTSITELSRTSFLSTLP